MTIEQQLVKAKQVVKNLEMQANIEKLSRRDPTQDTL
jgi:hypothetical protein